MERQSVDHSNEIETRLKAIRVSKSDTCVFFKCRDGAGVSIKECFFCTYGKFNEKQQQANLNGLCKFKK